VSVTGDAGLSQETIDTFVNMSHGHLAGVQAMLAEHPELINARSSLDESPLGAAAHVGNRAMAEYLLAQGASPELPASAMLGQADTVRAAVEADLAVANLGGAHDIPILFHAVIGGHEALARFLAERGADTGPAVSGALLHAAIRARHPALVRWTLDLGADRQSLDFENKTAVQRARESGEAEIVALVGG
jgi:ankyrin repeat protein